MKQRLLNFFSKGHSRTLLAKKNIIISLFIKIISMVIMFSMVSLSIQYLGKEAYGLWVLMSGILVWTALFDFGLTNGLRNKLTEALASDDYSQENNRNMVSATYAIMLIIATISFVLISLLIYWLDWKTLLEVKIFTNSEIQLLLVIIFFAFSLNLFLKPIHAILNALQWSSIVLIFPLIGSLLSIATLFLLFQLEIKNKLLIYTISMSFLPILVMIVGSIALFRNKLKNFKPNFKNIDFKVAKEVSKLGYSFFVIQLAGLIIAETDNIIIAVLFGTEEVTNYNIVFKYFSLFIVATSILLTPFWSAFTDAYIKKEFDWIRKAIKRLTFSFLAMALVIILFIFYSNDVYTLWISEDIVIPFSLSITTGIYMIVYSFSNIFVFFINGTGYIKLQMYIGSLMALINIPLSYLFASTLGYGVTGVIMASTFCAAMPGIFSYIQYQKIINNTASGIWKL